MTDETPQGEIRRIERLVPAVRARLEQNQHVRRVLPRGGRVHIDRQLPFLVVYRTTPHRQDRGTRELVFGEASYLIAPGERHLRDAVDHLVEGIAGTLTAVFGRFLVIELWAGPQLTVAADAAGEIPPPPAFKVVVPKRLAGTPSVARLAESLRAIRIRRQPADVEVAAGSRLAPPQQRSLLQSTLRQLEVSVIGLEVRPVYRGGEEELYPVVHRALHRQLSRALQQAAFEFARRETTDRPRHYQALGRRAVVKAVWEVDRELTEVARMFDVLLLVTPVNTERAWRSFARGRYAKAPAFVYRPLPLDVALLQRRLFCVPIERVEDPTLASIFTEKQHELSRQLQLLGSRGTRRFLFDSLALYGEPEPWLSSLADDLLTALPASSRDGSRNIDAGAFATRVEQELARYREVDPEFASRVELRDDISSLMVSRGNLLLGRHMSFPARRAEALIQHEIGTHAVTYHNGRHQPFRLLASGLAGYEQLQEGLGVFAEYLVGGLTPARLRLIAGRVRAVRAVIDGAEFTDTFRLLSGEYGFRRRTAYMVALRIHRGGGFTKDAIYLRGVAALVDYLRDRGRIETLLVGKIAPAHAPVIEELQRRGVLKTPALVPRYLTDPAALSRLEIARKGLDVRDLAERHR